MESNIVFAIIVSFLGILVFLATALIADRFSKGAREKREESDKLFKKLEEKRSRRKEAPMESQTAFRKSTAIPSETMEHEILEKLFKNYHEQALQQSTVQFWFSVAASTIGFSLIAFMLVFHLKDKDALEIVISMLPGAIFEAVSVLFFSQANETRKRASDLFDKLRRDKCQHDALEIVSTIGNNDLKASVTAKIALHFAGLDAGDMDIAIKN